MVARGPGCCKRGRRTSLHSAIFLKRQRKPVDPSPRPGSLTTGGYTTNLSWDSQLNLQQASGPNDAVSIFGYDGNGNNTSASGPDGDSFTKLYQMGRLAEVKSGRRFTRYIADGLGRTIRTESGYYTTAQTPVPVVQTVVETEYAPCACTRLGKMKRVSLLPHVPGATAVWTTFEYDELGRTTKVTLPPNTGTTGSSGFTTYEYVANTVKVTDPAGKWKKHTMDGFGNLVSVEEPKPGSGSYVTNYTYTMFGELKRVFPETGTTEYGYELGRCSNGRRTLGVCGGTSTGAG